MAYSLSEEGQEKGVLLVTLGKKGMAPDIRKIPLKPLRRVRKERGTLEEVLAAPSDDYVWVSLTEKTDLDISDMQMRLRGAFPYLLGVRNENAVVMAQEDIQWKQLQETTAYELFLQFCPDLDEQEREIVKSVIDTVKGVGE